MPIMIVFWDKILRRNKTIKDLKGRRGLKHEDIQSLSFDALHLLRELEQGNARLVRLIESEIRQRESWPSTAAFWISLCSLLVAAFALFK